MDHEQAQRRPLRVLLTIHYPLDPNAGAAGCTIRLADALRELGHQTTIFSLDSVRPRFDRRTDHALFPFRASARAANLMMSGAIDVVDASTGDLAALPRRFVASRPAVVVARSHGLEALDTAALMDAVSRDEAVAPRTPSIYHGRHRLAQVARSLRSADGVSVLNTYERDWTIDTLGLSHERVHLGRNGLDRSFIGLAPPAPGDSHAIAVIGPHVWRKGAVTAVAALTKAMRRWPELRVSWLGADEGQVREGFPADLQGRLTVAAHFRHEDLPGLLERHDILLFMSRSEGFPGAVLEAMACGLAVVSSDIPGPVDVVAGSGAALFVPPDDPVGAANAISHLYRNPGELHLMRRRAYDHAQRYRWTVVAGEVAHYYYSLRDRKLTGRTESVLSRRRRRSR